MSYHRLCVTSLQALLVFCSSAHAAGPISPASDMLGIRLTMNRDQAKSIITGSYPGSKIVDLPVQVGTPQYKVATTAGFFADITSKENQAANQQRAQQAQSEFDARVAAGFGNSPLNRTVSAAGDFGHDKIYVQVNPNEGTSDIFGVSRYKEFSRQEPVSAKGLLDSFVDKYGPYSLSNGGTSYTWLAPGVRETAQRLRLKCSLYSNIDSYLYEQPESVSPETIGNYFVIAMNKVATAMTAPFDDVSKCGTVLQLSLTLSSDRVYVTQMSVVLMDVTKGVGEVRQLLAVISRQTDAAKQDQLRKASQNKPRL
jgi:hypothetical protein